MECTKYRARHDECILPLPQCAAWPRTKCLSLNSISVLAFKTPCLPGLSSEPLFSDVYFISHVLLVWGSVEFSSGA